VEKPDCTTIHRNRSRPLAPTCTYLRQLAPTCGKKINFPAPRSPRVTPQFFSHSSNNPFIHSSGFGFVAAVPRQDILPRRVRLTLAPRAPIFARLFSLVDAILTC
jgi:hypothetical protein